MTFFNCIVIFCWIFISLFLPNKKVWDAFVPSSVFASGDFF